MRKSSLSAHPPQGKTRPLSCAFIVCTLAVCLFAFGLSPSYAQNNLGSDYLFSPSTAQSFYELACRLADTEKPGINSQNIEQAVIFLNAAVAVDSRANYVLPEIVSLLSRSSEQDYSRLLFEYLKKYVDPSADLQPTRRAVRYLLDQLNSREEKEQMLTMLLQTLGSRNLWLNSELSTLLGLLMAEKTDYQAATSLLMQAYGDNKYNKLAFDKLFEISPEMSNESVYLERLRLELGKNPINMKAAVDLAQFAEQLQLYQTASDAYEYAVQLHYYLFPSQPVGPQIYLPWAISTYNTQRGHHKCLQIAKQIRESGRFDLFLETIAAKALEKTSDTSQAAQILNAAEQNAIRLAQQDRNFNYQHIAWFYCFGLINPEKALDWANKAYSNEPNSPTAASLLAYSLVANEQLEWAKTIIDNYQPTQISELALGLIELKEGQKESAVATLKSAISRDPGSLEAQVAKSILTQNGSDYVPTVNSETILVGLTSVFGRNLVPKFNTPENIISAQLNLRGSRFQYGAKFDASITITNNSELPLVICEDGLFAGSFRIDAALSGDIEKNIPSLITKKVCPSEPVEPGSSLIVPVTLFTGELRQILTIHPQATVDIEFTVFLDPVAGKTGQVANTLADIIPIKANVSRPGIEISNRYLQNRLNLISKGQQGQKIKAAQLIVGLLAEQNAMAYQQPMYEFTYAEWMPNMLKSALVNNLSDEDWVAKIHTLAALYDLPMDYQLIEAVAGNINETHWPARLITVALLAESQSRNFKKVLDWTARYDSNQLVRQMAIASGATDPTAPQTD